jgi:prepilin-type N-terminal cleavage/methylation domain-containing protein
LTMSKPVRQFVLDPLTMAVGIVFRRKGGNGFSLVELILVMVLVGIAAVMVAPFVGHVLSNLLEGRELSDRESQGAASLERFVRDVRDVEGSIEHNDNNVPVSCLGCHNSGKKVLKGGNDILYVIDSGSGTLFFIGKPEATFLSQHERHVLARYLDANSSFDKKTIGTNPFDFDIVTLNLKINLINGGLLELSASAVPRQNFIKAP